MAGDLLPLTRRAVLVVEAADDLRSLVVETLLQAGFEASGVRDGKVAVGRCRESPSGFAWLLLDLSSADDVPQVIAAIRRSQPGCVIVLTGSQPTPDFALPTGRDIRYIAKPFHRAQLVALFLGDGRDGRR
jgi:DNA-binding response OmpR family regulator